ncbi:HpcH/HpaI aldolase/citrate lyase family protein [Rossellomorea sp. SC111]|uniref:HpcH/HpaI aldolase/citrate lyase family protein n=1 Tax=Rossellomorea sp. SC111 TaxID=2968985 RepID=UPI00215B5DB6|nr:HpcH/HpaI aldolase/citrate lyase family protein [Rossellomorea sp. SC111]MCR8848192.1 HpcH/HpaI aldolase/citrate lyase family protein [Rossellomorea sp. SC111]
MRHFSYLSALQTAGVFYVKPANITKDSPKELLEYSLGATLYMPATRTDISDLVSGRKYPELCSMVLCLEDSIADSEVEQAERMVIHHLQSIYESLQNGRLSTSDLPLIFLRVRSPEQISTISSELGEAIDCLTGFVFPKFSLDNASSYLEQMIQAGKATGARLYGMPIFETSDLLEKETRYSHLSEIKKLLHSYKEHILNLRIGATDLCGLYGVRRNCHTTIYDISLVKDFIIDVLNYFGREYTISGPVWEYFEHASSRIMKPELRQSPFRESYGDEGLRFRSQLLSEYHDGLIKETLLDLANGLNGKTVIHPSHIKIVESLNAVSKEDYLDALSITEGVNGKVGVMKSEYSNRMNEIKPHYLWAQKVLRKSTIYGVYNENHNYIDLLSDTAQTSTVTQYGH